MIYGDDGPDLWSSWVQLRLFMFLSGEAESLMLVYRSHVCGRLSESMRSGPMKASNATSTVASQIEVACGSMGAEYMHSQKPFKEILGALFPMYIPHLLILYSANA